MNGFITSALQVNRLNDTEIIKTAGLSPPSERNGTKKINKFILKYDNKVKISKSPDKNRMKYLLPPQNVININQKTLVLDLDETLVHSTFEPSFEKPTLELSTVYQNKTYPIYVNVRPGVYQFLEELSSYYEIVVFTASMREYADVVISSIDPQHHIKSRLFRNSCLLNTAGQLVKDLGRLGRDIKNVILLDNSPHCYSLNKENGLPIKTWYKDHFDRELIKLIPVLKKVSEFYDVRAELCKMIIGDTFIWSIANKWLKDADNDKMTLTLSSSEKQLNFQKNPKYVIEKADNMREVKIDNAKIVDFIYRLKTKDEKENEEILGLPDFQVQERQIKVVEHSPLDTLILANRKGFEDNTTEATNTNTDSHDHDSLKVLTNDDDVKERGRVDDNSHITSKISKIKLNFDIGSAKAILPINIFNRKSNERIQSNERPNIKLIKKNDLTSYISERRKDAADTEHANLFYVSTEPNKKGSPQPKTVVEQSSLLRNNTKPLKKNSKSPIRQILQAQQKVNITEDDHENEVSELYKTFKRKFNTNSRGKIVKNSDQSSTITNSRDTRDTKYSPYQSNIQNSQTLIKPTLTHNTTVKSPKIIKTLKSKKINNDQCDEYSTFVKNKNIEQYTSPDRANTDLYYGSIKK